MYQLTFFMLIYFMMPEVLCSKPHQPNILLLMADDLAIGDVGIFGNTTIRTPNIDSIGKRGVTLTQHLTASAVCSPSRAAFLTGRYPVRSGMEPIGIMQVMFFVASLGGLPHNETTVAEVAKDAGYRTALIGKWHQGVYCDNQGTQCHNPRNQGFDYYFGVPLTNLKDFGAERDGTVIIPDVYKAIFLSSFILAFSLCLLKYKQVLAGHTALFLALIYMSLLVLVFYFLANVKMINSILIRNFDVVEQPIRIYNNLTQRLVNEGVQFIQDTSKDDRPFLLMMSWVQVHTALHNLPNFEGVSKHGRYGDNVEELDWSVGQMLQALEDIGIANNTFVYFTSDNGGHNEEKDIHGNKEGGYNGIYRGGKGQGSMDGGIRVPSVAMWPGHIPSGLVINQPTSLMDIFPTISNILGVPLPKDRIIDGKNLLPLLMGESNEVHHEFLFHYCGVNVYAVRYQPEESSATWKLHFAWPLWTPGTEGCHDHHICSCYTDFEWLEKPLLFNIAEDPSERQPLDLDKNRAILYKINNALHNHKQTVLPVETQYSLLNLVWRPWLQPCCNFPHCDCEDRLE